VYKSLEEEQLPAIITDGIEQVFLSVTHSIMDSETNLFDLADIDMLDTPSSESMVDSIKKCLNFGYITAEGGSKYTLTEIGDIVRKMRFIDFQQAQTILSGYINGVSIQDLAFIIALYRESEVILYQKEPMTAFTDPNYKNKEIALRASIPDYLINVDSHKYGGDELPEYTPLMPSDEPFFRAKLLISDDFIEALLVFNRFVKELENVNGDVDKLEKWCLKNSIDMNGAITLAAMREEIINEIIIAGLNPYYNGQNKLSNTPAKLFLTRIINIKKCIYAGLQYNTIRGKKGEYKTPTGQDINLNPMLSPMQSSKIKEYGLDDYMPNAIVTNQIIINKFPKSSKEKYPPLLYRLIPSIVSVMDGYVL
jgi:hypothetical protein